jgi:hypothetical protein
MHGALAIKRPADLAHTSAIAASVSVAARSVFTLVLEKVSLLGSSHGEMEYGLFIWKNQLRMQRNTFYLVLIGWSELQPWAGEYSMRAREQSK